MSPVSGLAAIAALIANAFISAAQTTPARPAFEVASIKLQPGACRIFGSEWSSNRISKCGIVADFIQAAYVLNSGPANSHPMPMQLPGAPDWTRSVAYDIIAKAPAAASVAMMNGLMLQTLLEDRFKLKIHRETREVPVYILTVAESGLKLKSLKEGACVQTDRTHPPAPLPPGVAPPNYCGSRMVRGNGPNMTMTARGMTMAELAADISRDGLDRPVIDRTGLSGLFDIHLAWANESPSTEPGNPPVPVDAANSSVFTAVREQLGLKLSPDKGPVEVLVIDHIERPSEN